MIEAFPARLDGDAMARVLIIGVAANLLAWLLVERLSSVPVSATVALFNPALVGVALLAAAAQPRPLPVPWLLALRALGLVSAAVGVDAILNAFSVSIRFGTVVALSSIGAGVVMAAVAVGLSMRMRVWPDAAPAVATALTVAAGLYLAVGPAVFLAFRRSDPGALPIGVGLVSTLLAVGGVVAGHATPMPGWRRVVPVVVVVLFGVGAVWEMTTVGDSFRSSFGGDPGSFPTINPDRGLSTAQSVVRVLVPSALVLVLVAAALTTMTRLGRGLTTMGAEVRRLRPVAAGLTVATAVGSLALRWTDHRATVDHFGVSDGTGLLDWWADVSVAGTVLVVLTPVAVLALLGDPVRTGLTRRSWNLVLLGSGLLALGSIHRAFDVLRAGSPAVAALDRFWPAGPLVMVVATVVFVVLVRQWRRPELSSPAD